MLDVKIDEFGESFYNNMIPEVNKELETTGLANDENGMYVCMYVYVIDTPMVLKCMYVCARYACDQVAAFHDPADDSQVRRRIRIRQHGHGGVEVPHTYTAERLDRYHHRCGPGRYLSLS